MTTREMELRLVAIKATIDKGTDELRAALSDLGEMRDEQQEAFDNMPESLQDSERGQASQEKIEKLEGIHDDLESVIDTLDGLEL